MLTPNEEYDVLIAELNIINKEIVGAARGLAARRPGHWVTELDDVIEKHRRATRRLRELVLRRQANEENSH